MKVNPEIKITSDGSHTLYIPEIDEPYHSINGAITESNHVFIKNALLFRNKKNPLVFEVGFGTGLNCLLTAMKASEENLKVHYIGIEKNPLRQDLINQLNYPSILGKKITKLWEDIHKSPWDKDVIINDNFTLYKEKGDIKNLHIFSESEYYFDVIYFDAFAPDIQPDLWHPVIFQNIYKRSNKGAILTTYSAKGEVRRNLIKSGFKMEKIPGPPGKMEMLRGLKDEY